MNTGLTKMLRDLKLYRSRTILTLIGVLIGIAAVGAVLSAYAILNREMNRNFMATNPASIVFNIANLDGKAVTLIRKSYPKTDIAVRKTVSARVAKSDGTYGVIHLRAIEDFNNLQVDTFTLEKGAFPAQAFEMALERDCFKILKNLSKGVGESLSIQMPGGIAKEVRLSGVVHAPGLAPASMEHYSYGFLTLDGLNRLGFQGWYDEVRIVCHDRRFDREQMRKVARAMKKTLVENGYMVQRVDVLKPGQHPHASQLNSILFLLQAFTAISLLVACIIIINLMNFIMAGQSKQIAIMKAVGASTIDIVRSFFGYVSIISLIALAISFPIAISAGAGYSDLAAFILNFKIASYAVPGWVFILQSLTGILLPLAAAAYPIIKSSSRSVKDGLDEKVTGSTDRGSKKTLSNRIIIAANSKIIMPINNLFRKKSRTILAIFALTAGGILFMTSRNIVASIDKTVDASFQNFRWDYDIRLARNYREDKLQRVIKSITELDKAEVWGSSMMILKKTDGTDSANYVIKIIPEKSQLLSRVVADKFKADNGQNSLIITTALAADEKWLKPGTKARIECDGHIAEVIITGVVNEVPDFSTAYIKQDAYLKLFGGKFNQNILASAARHNLTELRDTTRVIETTLNSSGIEIAENWNLYTLRKAFVDHLRVIVAFLSVVAMLAVLVGGLSIGSAIGINISERKREIGVLRAVGVKSYQNIGMVLLEVLLMGIAGWLAAAVLSYPVSVLVGNYFGRIFLNSNLQNAISFPGAVQWLIISLAVSLASGFLPAWKAATSSLREMLAYE